MRERHGECHKTKEYRAWQAMNARCHIPSATGFHNYGGRGIIVCPRWRRSYTTFLSDVGRAPTPRHSIERIDNDGNYEPDNVRWATRHEQRLNQREKIKIFTSRPKPVRLWQYENLAGKSFGRWTVLSLAGNIRKADGNLGNKTWWCRCSCGTERIVRAESLNLGVSKSCGCLRTERTIERNRAQKAL